MCIYEYTVGKSTYEARATQPSLTHSTRSLIDIEIVT